MAASDGSRRPTVTVAVSTYRRPHLLPRLIAALEAQTIARDVELVIVDDASGDDTSEVLRTLAESTSFPMRVIVAARNGGPAVGRNLAWRAGTGEIVAFTDDDCVPQPGWLEAGALACRPGTLVVGRTAPAPDQEGNEGPYSRTLRVDDARFMQTCNVFYRRDELERLDGFAESFRTGEDTDLGLRATESGVRAEFVPTALVYHDIRPSDLRAKLRESRSWVDLPLVVRRHPQVRSGYLHRRLFWKRTHPLVILLWAGALLAFVWPVALVAALPWLYRRLLVEPLSPSVTGRLGTLVGALLVDSTEVVTMVRGSLRHKALVL